MLKEYPDVLTIKQLCKILRIGTNSAYKLIHNNTIGHIRIGHNIRIPKSCVIAYLSSAQSNVSFQ